MCGMAAPRLTTMTFGGTSEVAIDTNGRDVVIAGALETNWVRAALGHSLHVGYDLWMIRSIDGRPDSEDLLRVEIH